MELRVESDPTLVITQEHHYYPFGMNMIGIERQGTLMYQFNGMVEKEEAFGLELYETPFRSYDAQLGRFWQVEPLADIYCSISMYQFAYNNPVSFNDPSGLNPIGDPPDKEEERDNSGTSEAQGEIESAGQIIPVDSSPKIGAGGYTWDLGNTRANPYSMGGTPGRGPGRINSGVVLYDRKGNFVSGDITNNSAIVAVTNDKGKGQSKWDFLTSGGGFVTQEELLDRATWVIGEAGSGSDKLTYRKYAHSIENAVKLGIHGTGSPSSTFEAMRKILMQDAGWLVNDEGSLVDKDGNYAKNYKDLVPVDKDNKIVDLKKQARSVRISMSQYRMRTFDTRTFTATRTNPSLRTSNQVNAISSVIESLLFPALDPTVKENGMGTNAWGAGHKFYHAVNPKAGGYAEFLTN